MGWASNYIAKLKDGETIKFRPRGNSMSGRIESGDLVTVEPAIISNLEIDDIVLCSVSGNQFLHLIKAKRPNQFLIGNNRGHTNGWTAADKIYGKVIEISS